MIPMRNWKQWLCNLFLAMGGGGGVVNKVHCGLDEKCQYLTLTFPIMHHICAPKFYISIVFNFSWDGCNTQEN